MLRYAADSSSKRRARPRSVAGRPPPAPSYAPPTISLAAREQFIAEWLRDFKDGALGAVDKYELQAEGLRRWQRVLSALEAPAVGRSRPWAWHTAPVPHGFTRLTTILHVRDSVELPGLKAAFIGVSTCAGAAPPRDVALRVKPTTPLAPYAGYILTERQFALFPLSVSTAVEAPYLNYQETEYLIVGDPTQPSAQANHIAWSKRNTQFGWSVKDSLVLPTFKRQVFVPGKVYDDHLFLKAHKSLAEGKEAMLYYGSRFWSAAEPACAICLVKRCIAPTGTECNKQQRCAACTIEFISCAHRGCKVGYHLDCLRQRGDARADAAPSNGVLLCPFHAAAHGYDPSVGPLKGVHDEDAQDGVASFSLMARRHSSVIRAPLEDGPPATPERVRSVTGSAASAASPAINFSAYSVSELTRWVPSHAPPSAVPSHSATAIQPQLALPSHRVTRSSVDLAHHSHPSAHPLHGTRNDKITQQLYATRTLAMPMSASKNKSKDKSQAHLFTLLQRQVDYEIRVVPELVEIGQHVQLGMYVVAGRNSPIQQGQLICLYGGLRHGMDWFGSAQAKECKLPHLKSHSLRIVSTDEVYDGRPAAEMYRRPSVPKTLADVRRVQQLTAAELLPSRLRSAATPADRDAFDEFELDPQGHMINCAGHRGAHNAKYVWIDSGPDGLVRIAVVVATRRIRPGEQIIVANYQSWSHKTQGVKMLPLQPVGQSEPRGASSSSGHVPATPAADFSKLTPEQIKSLLAPIPRPSQRPLLAQLDGTATGRTGRESAVSGPAVKGAAQITSGRESAVAVDVAPVRGDFDALAAVNNLLNHQGCANPRPLDVPASSLTAASASATSAVASVQQQEAATLAVTSACPVSVAAAAEVEDVDMTGGGLDAWDDGADADDRMSDVAADSYSDAMGAAHSDADFDEVSSDPRPGRTRAAAPLTTNPAEKLKQMNILKDIQRDIKQVDMMQLLHFRALHKQSKLFAHKQQDLVVPSSARAKLSVRHPKFLTPAYIKPSITISPAGSHSPDADARLEDWWLYEHLFIPSARVWALFPLWQQLGGCCLHPDGQIEVDQLAFQRLSMRTFHGFSQSYLSLAHVQSNSERQTQRQQFLRNFAVNKHHGDLKFAQTKEARQSIKLSTICSVPMCVACTYTMYNVSEKTFKRDQDVVRLYDGPIPKRPRAKPQRDIAVTAVDTVLGDAEHAPNKRNTVLLPGVHQRKGLIEHMLAETPADANGKKPSSSTFERAIKESGVHFTTSHRTMLGKCVHCQRYDGIRNSVNSTKDQKDEATRLRQQHLAQQRGQRHASFRFGAEAQLNDSNSWHLGIDGMDQFKTNVPHPTRNSKQEIKALTVKVMGVHIEGGPIPAMAYLCPEEVSGNANLTCEVVQRALRLSFNEERKQAEEQGRAPRFPKHLRLSMDNATGSNKNFTFFNYLALLVNQGVFESVHIVFYLPGHGHCKLDQMFSRFSVRLASHPAFTMEQLAAELRNAYQPTAKTHEQALIALEELDAIATPKNEMAMVDLHCPNHGDDDIAGCLFTTRNQRALQQHADECCYLPSHKDIEERIRQQSEGEVHADPAATATAAADATGAAPRSAAPGVDATAAARAPSGAAAALAPAPAPRAVPPLYTEVVTTVAEVGAWLLPQIRTRWGGITKCYEFLFTNLVGHGTVMETRRIRVEFEANGQEREVKFNERQMEVREGQDPIVLLAEGYIVKGEPRVTPPCEIKDLIPPASHKSAPLTNSDEAQIQCAFGGMALSSLGRSLDLIPHAHAAPDGEEKEENSLKWHAVYSNEWPADGHVLWCAYFRGLCVRQLKCPQCAQLRADAARADQLLKDAEATAKKIKRQMIDSNKSSTKSGRAKSHGAAAGAAGAAGAAAAADAVVAAAVPRHGDLDRQQHEVSARRIHTDTAKTKLKQHITNCKHPSTNFINGWWWRDEAKCVTHLLRPSEVQEQQFKRRPPPEAIRQAVAAVTRPAGSLIVVHEVRPADAEARGAAGACSATAATAPATAAGALAALRPIESGMFVTTFANDTSLPFSVGKVVHVLSGNRVVIRWYEPSITVDEQKRFNRDAMQHFFSLAAAPPPPPPAPPAVPAPSAEIIDPARVRQNCSVQVRGPLDQLRRAIVRGVPRVLRALLQQHPRLAEGQPLPPPPPPIPPEVPAPSPPVPAAAPGDDDGEESDAAHPPLVPAPTPLTANAAAHTAGQPHAAAAPQLSRVASSCGPAFPPLNTVRDFAGRGFVFGFSASSSDPLTLLVRTLHGTIVDELSAGDVLVLSNAELELGASCNQRPPAASQRARELARLGAAAAPSGSSPLQDQRATAAELGCEIWSYDRLLHHVRGLTAGLGPCQLIIRDAAGHFKPEVTTYPLVPRNGVLVGSNPMIDYDAPGNGSPFQSAGQLLSARDRAPGVQPAPRLFCEICRKNVDNEQSHHNDPEHQRLFDSMQEAFVEAEATIKDEMVMCRIMQQIVDEDKAEEAAESAADKAAAEVDSEPPAAEPCPCACVSDSARSSPSCSCAPILILESPTAAINPSHRSTASASVAPMARGPAGVEQSAGMMMDGDGGSSAAPAPKSAQEEKRMLAQALRDSKELQSAHSDRCSEEQRQLQHAIDASRSFEQPAEIDPMDEAIIDSVVDQYLRSIDLEEAVILADGDCLLNSVIRACEDVGVPLHDRLFRLGVVVPEGEAVSALHMRRALARWITTNLDFFKLITCDPDLTRRGLVEFVKRAVAAAADGAAGGSSSSSSSSSAAAPTVPRWLNLEETLEELMKPGAWRMRYIVPIEPPEDDRDLMSQTYLFDYLPSILPFVIGARIHILCTSALLGKDSATMASMVATEGSQCHLLMDPNKLISSHYSSAAANPERVASLSLALSDLAEITIIHRPEQNHYHCAVKRFTGGETAATEGGSGSRSTGVPSGGVGTAGAGDQQGLSADEAPAAGANAHNSGSGSTTADALAESGGVAGEAAAPDRLSFSEVIAALFSYDIDPASRSALQVKFDCMQQNGPLIVQLLVATQTSPSQQSISGREPYNNSVKADDNCHSSAVWKLQQWLLFNVLMSGVTSISWEGTDGVRVVHQPRALVCERFRRVRQDAHALRLQQGRDQRRASSAAASCSQPAPPLTHLVHSDGAILSDQQGENALSFLNVVSKDEHAFKAVLSKARRDGSLVSFAVTRSSCGARMSKASATELIVRNEIVRLQANSNSAAVPHPDTRPPAAHGPAASSAPCTVAGCFFTTLSAPSALAAEHGCAVEIIREVMVDAVSQKAVASLTDQDAAPAPTAQLDFDSVWSTAPAGFGTSQVQLYGKTIATSTALHDEIADSSALNYATLSSRGVSLWIGINLRHAVESQPAEGDKRNKLLASFVKLMDAERAAGSYHQLLRLLQEYEILPQLVFQLPGESVLSPSGQGAAHAVLGAGSHMLNLAINLSTSPQACDDIMRFYKGQPTVAHNSGRATTRVLCGIWLKTEKNWPLQDPIWQEQLVVGNSIIQLAQSRCSHSEGVSIYTRKFDDSEEEGQPNHELKFCGDECVPAGGVNRDAYQPVSGCGNEVLWKSINNLCLACFYHKHSLMECKAGAPGLYPHMTPSGFSRGFRRAQLEYNLDNDMYKISVDSISRSSSNSSSLAPKTAPPPPPPPPPPTPPPLPPPPQPPQLPAHENLLSSVSSMCSSMSAMCTQLLRSCRISCCSMETRPPEYQRVPLIGSSLYSRGRLVPPPPPPPPPPPAVPGPHLDQCVPIAETMAAPASAATQRPSQNATAAAGAPPLAASQAGAAAAGPPPDATMSDAPAAAAAAPATPTAPVISRSGRPERKAKQGALQKLSGLAAPGECDDDSDNDMRPRTKRARFSSTSQTAVQAKSFKEFSAWPEQLFNRAVAWEWRPMSIDSARRNGWLREQEIDQRQLCAWMPAHEAVLNTGAGGAGKDDGVTLTTKMLDHTRSRVCCDD